MHVLWQVTFGDVGELIVENLLLQGQNLMSGSVQMVSEKLDTGPGSGGGKWYIIEDNNINKEIVIDIGEVVKQKFLELIDAKVLHRVSCPGSESDEVTVNPHQLPPIEGKAARYALLDYRLM